MPPDQTHPSRRGVALLAASLLLLAPAAPFAQVRSDAVAWQALKNDAIVLFRHAIAPGVGDPPGFNLDDCSTQRNLDAEGQAQALHIGRAFEAQGVKVGAVWTSAWCRAKETAELAFPGKLRVEPAFNSFFDDRSLESMQTGTARDLLLEWRGPGVLVVVTHQVNITTLTGVMPRSGEGVVLLPSAGRLEKIGQIMP